MHSITQLTTEYATANLQVTDEVGVTFFEVRELRLSRVQGLQSDMRVLAAFRWNTVSSHEVPLSCELHHPAVTAVPFRRELIPYYNDRYRAWADTSPWIVKVRIPEIVEPNRTPRGERAVHLATALVIFQSQFVYLDTNGVTVTL